MFSKKAVRSAGRAIFGHPSFDPEALSTELACGPQP